MSVTIDELLAAAHVIPVLTVKDIKAAIPLAVALKSGGLRVVEMTWRTDNALEIMQEMKRAVPELIVGMGTIRTPRQIDMCVSAGADFLVSPGLTPTLTPSLVRCGLSCLPGVATASEAMSAMEAGFEALKFFPAEQAGGIAYLKSLYGPLPEIRFCPTGSITREKAAAYLALPNVACIGGSWIAPGPLIEAGDWDGITANARMATALA